MKSVQKIHFSFFFQLVQFRLLMKGFLFCYDSMLFILEKKNRKIIRFSSNFSIAPVEFVNTDQILCVSHRHYSFVFFAFDMRPQSC